MSEVLRKEVALECSAAHAFRVFTEFVDLWWPKGHRKSTEGTLRFEAGESGRLLDIAPDGTEWMMARVTAFEPPHRLTMDWFPGSPMAPTHVEVSFANHASGTIVTIVHTAPIGAAAEIWPQRVALFEGGWSAVLDALAGAVLIQRSER